MIDMDTAWKEAEKLLEALVSTPRTSRSESRAADILQEHIAAHGYIPERFGDNVMCRSRHFDPSRPALLLNSHIDTVRPVSTWTRDPFTPVIENGRLYGLGTNDAGASLVSLLYAFFIKDEIPNGPNMIFLATCQEEVSGAEGMKMMVSHLPEISVAIVGEPTGMQPAIAEKGLMVLDIDVHGKSGHAARNEGINAIYRANEIITLLKDFKFEKESPLLGPVRLSVTMISAGTQHNVIPDLCRLTADVRSNECYSNIEIFDTLKSYLPEWCDISARSFTLNSSRIPAEHSLIRRAVELGLKPFGSPTLSDQAILSCPSFKMGPGDSARSHSADEYISLDELEGAIKVYLSLLSDGF